MTESQQLMAQRDLVRATIDWYNKNYSKRAPLIVSRLKKQAEELDEAISQTASIPDTKYQFSC